MLLSAGAFLSAGAPASAQTEDLPPPPPSYMTKFFAAVNWWANRRIRLTAGYGCASLDKDGLTGHTNQYFTRVQWIY